MGSQSVHTSLFDMWRRIPVAYSSIPVKSVCQLIKTCVNLNEAWVKIHACYSVVKVCQSSKVSSFPCFSQKMSALSAASVGTAAVTESTEQKKPLKPCCACPETKKVRDAWWGAGQRNWNGLLVLSENVYSSIMFVSTSIIEKGEENCRDLIEAHKDCMRALGFKV